MEHLRNGSAWKNLCRSVPGADSRSKSRREAEAGDTASGVFRRPFAAHGSHSVGYVFEVNSFRIARSHGLPQLNLKPEAEGGAARQAEVLSVRPPAGLW
jgi:hypothetical protein